jgi:myo-inositol-1(or 4)-monophosphatase
VSTDPATLREAAVAWTREAGAVLLESHGGVHALERKGVIDLVTETDRRAEALILERLRQRFPSHGVLAEESGAAAGSAVRWLIDPLDGTTNYAHNYPFFCVSIAAEVEGRLAAGAIYDPVRDEMFAASAGQGATLNGAPIQVSAVQRLVDGLLVTGFPYDVREHPEKHVPLFQAFLTRAQAVRRDGSAALNFCYLAMGRFDGFWEARLSAWDMAAGVLIVREAGGRVTRYDGSEFALDGKQVLATNGSLHEEMMEVLGGFG